MKAVDIVASKLPEHPKHDIEFNLHHNTFVSLKHGYCYFGIPKNASSYIKSIIHELEGLPEIPNKFDYMPDISVDMKVHHREQFHMPSLIDLNDSMLNNIMRDPNFQWIAVYRNPVERTLSAWADKILSYAPTYIDYIEETWRRKPPELISFDEFISEISQQDLKICDTHWRFQEYCSFTNVFRPNRIHTPKTINYLEKYFEETYQKKITVKPINETSISIEKKCSQYCLDKIIQLYKNEPYFITWDKDNLIGVPKSSFSKIEMAIIDRHVMIYHLFKQYKETLK